ncbi:brix domain-containing protein ZK795.3-like [Macadamia integrifolia]|uniref:brix domain-containing protein ZK795.3-like n=1 Tax=Macadamia integrifolia TaxID=60698 RepID=UPI001C52DCA3|nr:brix domain-containing protein ZK795.3-like [Macadamia integrifolia]
MKTFHEKLTDRELNPSMFKIISLILNFNQVLKKSTKLCSWFAFLQVISEIIETCRAHDFTDVVLVHEHRGQPDGLIVCHLPFGPTAYFGLLNVVTRHDIKDRKSIGTMPEVYPHLILNNFSTKLGQRTANILKHLFPVPKPDSKRIITFANQSDYISFRHHTYEKHGGPKSLELKEIGPRFELRLYQIKLGTVDQSEAQNEWVIRPYMNTAKKQKILGD